MPFHSLPLQLQEVPFDTDTIFCFDALTGKEVWRHSYPASGRK